MKMRSGTIHPYPRENRGMGQNITNNKNLWLKLINKDIPTAITRRPLTAVLSHNPNEEINRTLTQN